MGIINEQTVALVLNLMIKQSQKPFTEDEAMLYEKLLIAMKLELEVIIESVKKQFAQSNPSISTDRKDN